MATPLAVDGVKRERKRARYSEEEEQLILDTHEAHWRETWAKQAEIYSQEAAKRGLPSSMKIGFFVSKCRRLQAEYKFVTDRGGAFSRASCRRWAVAEEQVLHDWNLNRRSQDEYEVFITRMRQEVDPSYFRSFASVVEKLRVLAGRNTGEGAASDVDGEHNSESVALEIKRQREERSDSGSDSGRQRGAESRASLDAVITNVSTGMQEGVENKLRCKRSVYSDEEQQLMLATHDAHADKAWAMQAELYNEAAAALGLPASQTLGMFYYKIKRMVAERKFGADRSAKYAVEKRRRWENVEDRALRLWNHRNNPDDEYEGFIKRMRDQVDPGYFRPFLSVMSRLRSPSLLDACEGDASIDGGDDGGGAGTEIRERQLVEETHCAATSTDAVIDGGAGSEAESSASPGVVPVIVSMGVQEIVERKLRCIQSLLRASDAALLSKEPPSPPSALFTLHKNILEMIHDALSAFEAAAPPSDRGQAFPTPKPQMKMNVEGYLALQSKTLISIMDEKVEAEKERAGQLAEQHQQDQDALKQQIAELKAKLASSSTEVTELRDALKNSQAELADQAASLTQLTRQNQELTSELDALRLPKAAKIAAVRGPEAVPLPEPESRPTSSQRPAPSSPFRGQSDAHMKRGPAPPSGRQQQLADMLSQVDDFDMC